MLLLFLCNPIFLSWLNILVIDNGEFMLVIRKKHKAKNNRRKIIEDGNFLCVNSTNELLICPTHKINSYKKVSKLVTKICKQSYGEC